MVDYDSYRKHLHYFRVAILPYAGILPSEAHRGVYRLRMLLQLAIDYSLLPEYCAVFRNHAYILSGDSKSGSFAVWNIASVRGLHFNGKGLILARPACVQDFGIDIVYLVFCS